MCASGLGEAGSETSLLSLRESQGRCNGGVCLVSLCQGHAGGPLATWQLAVVACPRLGEDSYHSTRVETHCLHRGPESSGRGWASVVKLRGPALARLKSFCSWGDPACCLGGVSF